MITQLSLYEFGKFREKTFNLAPITLIYGANEAGKTTFFDGLFQALCNPSETKKLGRVLKARYSPTRRASVVFDPTFLAANSISGSTTTSASYSISDDEFMNLYAIRAGDFNLEMSQGSDWMERLKSRLFHGGIDPKVLIEEFEKLSSDKRNFVHNKKLEEEQKRAIKSRQDLEARRRERENLLARELELAQLEKSGQETGKQKQALTEQLRLMDLELALEDKITQRQKISAQLTRIEEWQSLEKSLMALKPFQDIEQSDWLKLAEATKQAALKLQIEKARREMQVKNMEGARLEYQSLNPELITSDHPARPAKSSLHGPKTVGQFSAGLGLILGIAAAFFIPGNVGLVLGGLTLGVGLALSILSWKKYQALSSLEAVQFKEYLAREAERVARHEHLALQKSKAHEKFKALEKEMEGLDRLLAQLGEEADAAARAEKQWLHGLGLKSESELWAKLSERDTLKAERPKRLAEIETLSPDRDVAELGRDLLRKLATFDQDGIANRGRDDASLQRYRRERSEVQFKLEAATQSEQKILVQREGLAGEIRGALGNLAGDIVKLEDETAQLDLAVKNREMDKQAAALVLDIFKGLGDGSDQMLLGLAEEMQQMLVRILPSDRGLSLQGLGAGQWLAQDAGGGQRGLENLSTGTRDSVVLAAKLALALKSREGAGLLVLDEPFLAMDAMRETRALELLRDFHVTHGWQIILLSKHGHLKEKLQSLFANPLIVELS